MGAAMRRVAALMLGLTVIPWAAVEARVWPNCGGKLSKHNTCPGPVNASWIAHYTPLNELPPEWGTCTYASCTSPPPPAPCFHNCPEEKRPPDRRSLAAISYGSNRSSDPQTEAEWIAAYGWPNSEFEWRWSDCLASNKEQCSCRDGKHSRATGRRIRDMFGWPDAYEYACCDVAEPGGNTCGEYDYAGAAAAMAAASIVGMVFCGVLICCCVACGVQRARRRREIRKGSSEGASVRSTSSRHMSTACAREACHRGRLLHRRRCTRRIACLVGLVDSA